MNKTGCRPPPRRQESGRLVAVAVLVLGLLAGWAGVPGAQATLRSPAPLSPRPLPAPPPPTAADWQSGRLLVQLRPGVLLRGASDGVAPLAAVDPALRPVLAAWGLTRVEVLDAASDLYRLYAGAPTLDVAAAVRALRTAPGVAAAEPDYRLRPTFVPNDPIFARQWYLNAIAAPAAWDVTTGSSNVIVAMVDTGIAANHPDLTGQIVAGHNFVEDSDDTNDNNGHGTYTAGLVAARGNNDVGVAGVAWGIRLMPIKILDSDGSGNVGDFARGIRWATDHGARIVNISAGLEYPSASMHQAIQYAAEHGVLVVASAGNTPDGNPRYPAAFQEVFAVSATDEADKVAPFSSYGSFVDLAAPGDNMVSTGWANGRLGYEWASGTSSAAPLVTGAAALLLSVRSNLTTQQIEQYLEDGADDLGARGWDPYYGAGRLNVARSLHLLLGGTPTPTASPTAPPPLPPSATPTPPPPTLEPQPPTPTPAPAGAALTLNPAAALPGATVTLTGRGYTPGEFIGLRMTGPEGMNHELGTGQAAPDGTFSQAVQMPGGLEPGTGTMMALGAQSNVLTTAPIRIDGTPAPAATPSPAPPPAVTPTPGPPVGGGGSGLPPAPVPAPDATTAFAPATDPSQPSILYFAPVHHTLQGVFLAYWQAHGGLPLFGYPISEEFDEISTTDGKPYRVQYFQRNRFEYHPEYAGTANEVLLGLLGRDVTAGRLFSAAVGSGGEGQRYFPQTGHLLGGTFLAYWQSHGGLAIFGYPISEEFAEVSPTDGQTYTVQYFERNRFELHPEFAGTPNEVELGLLGVEVARAKQFIH